MGLLSAIIISMIEQLMVLMYPENDHCVEMKGEFLITAQLLSMFYGRKILVVPEGIALCFSCTE